MNSQITVSSDILIYAMRYAISRQTYAPLTIKESICENIKKLQDWELQKIKEEIEYQESSEEYAPEGTCIWGDLTNKAIWLEVKDIVNNELDMRKEK